VVVMVGAVAAAVRLVQGRRRAAAVAAVVAGGGRWGAGAGPGRAVVAVFALRRLHAVQSGGGHRWAGGARRQAALVAIGVRAGGFVAHHRRRRHDNLALLAAPRLAVCPLPAEHLSKGREGQVSRTSGDATGQV